METILFLLGAVAFIAVTGKACYYTFLYDFGIEKKQYVNPSYDGWIPTNINED